MGDEKEDKKLTRTRRREQRLRTEDWRPLARQAGRRTGPGDKKERGGLFEYEESGGGGGKLVQVGLRSG